MDRLARAAPWIRRWLREFGRACLDELCPQQCVGCGRAGVDLCAACASRLAWRRPPWCWRCGETLAVADAPCTASHRALRRIDVGRAPLLYAGLGGELVRRLKFERDAGLAQWLAVPMAAAVADWRRGPGRRAVVVAVPMHWRKLRRRRFDHAATLASMVAQRLHLTFAVRALARRRDTLPQGDVRVTSRQANVRDAFVVRRPTAVAGRAVLLIDDVRTSGCTVRECARLLRDAGATRVAVLTAVTARPATAVDPA